MTALAITRARAELLRAIADPNSHVYAAIPTLRGSWADADVWHRPADGREQKITAKIRPLEDARLVKRAPVGARYHSTRAYTLTPDGEKALADYDAKATR